MDDNDWEQLAAKMAGMFQALDALVHGPQSDHAVRLETQRLVALALKAYVKAGGR